jgi:hypothetical protein
MGKPTRPLGSDVWDFDQLRLSPETVGTLETRRQPPRHRPGDPFIKGPIPHPWIASACRLPGAGLPDAMASRFLCCRFQSPNRWGWKRSLRDCGSLTTRPDAASMRPSWPGCWPWNGGRVASWLSPSWIYRSRRPGRSVGRCMVRSLGVGGFRTPGLPTSWKVTPSCFGLLALGGLDAIGRNRAGVKWLCRVRPLPGLGLPGFGYIGTDRVGLRRPTARTRNNRENT